MFSLTIDAAGIARILIDRPEARNAVTVAGWGELAARVGEAGQARVLLLHATPGAAFCAGADLRELAGLAADPSRRAPFRDAMRTAFDAIAALPVPTIAAIERGCFGAGVALALACDLRIAAPGAQFAIPPAKLGIVYPVEDVARLATLVGQGQAIRLLASGDAIDGMEAARIGLVELPADDPLAAAQALAARIAANGPTSVRTLKLLARTPDADPRLFDAGFDSAEFGRWAAERLAR